MGARGPLKIPTHLRAVPEPAGRGTVAPKTAADTARRTAPAKPDDLPESIAALWDQIVPVLNEAGMLSPADGPTVELALRHFVQARRASDDLLAAESTVIRDEKNQRDAKHPSSQVMRDHSAEFLKYAAQLGLSFAARARVTLSTSEDKPSYNPFA